MASREEKISALSNLMATGVLTVEEFTRLIGALDGASVTAPVREKTPAEKTYEDYIRGTVAKAFKSPASIQFPPFQISMVKEAAIKRDFKTETCRFIETYVDAPNAYGTMLREEIIIGVSDDFKPLWWAQHVQVSPLLGKSKGWITMSKK